MPTKAQPRLRIVLIDGNPLIRLGVAALVQSQDDLTLVAAVADGAQGVTLCGQAEPDVVVTELQLPTLDGLGVAQLLRQRDRHARILFLTQLDGEENIFRAVRAGGSGYITKAANSDEILEAIRAVAAGRKYFPQHVASALASRFMQEELTPREVQVVKLMASGHSNRRLAAELKVSERTVTTHATHLMAKLGTKSRMEAVAVARQRGYLWPLHNA